MIITWFKTKQDVCDTLKAMEKKGWVWIYWQKPTLSSGWEGYFEKYQENGGFAILYQDKFQYAHCDFYWKRHWDKINFKDAIKELTGKSHNPKTLTYEIQYVRSDGVVFAKDTIDCRPIEELKEEMNKSIANANRIRWLLKAHSNKF